MNRFYKVVAISIILLFSQKAVSVLFIPPPGVAPTLDIIRLFPQDLESILISDGLGSGAIYEWGVQSGITIPSVTNDLNGANTTRHICDLISLGGLKMFTNRVTTPNSPNIPTQWGKGWQNCPLGIYF